jgi:hypothetical protein
VEEMPAGSFDYYRLRIHGWLHCQFNSGLACMGLFQLSLESSGTNLPDIYSLMVPSFCPSCMADESTPKNHEERATILKSSSQLLLKVVL